MAPKRKMQQALSNISTKKLKTNEKSQSHVINVQEAIELCKRWGSQALSLMSVYAPVATLPAHPLAPAKLVVAANPPVVNPPVANPPVANPPVANPPAPAPNVDAPAPAPRRRGRVANPVHEIVEEPRNLRSGNRNQVASQNQQALPFYNRWQFWVAVLAAVVVVGIDLSWHYSVGNVCVMQMPHTSKRLVIKHDVPKKLSFNALLFVAGLTCLVLQEMKVVREHVYAIFFAIHLLSVVKFANEVHSFCRPDIVALK